MEGVTAHRAPRDLRQWMAAVEAVGQLRRIEDEGDSRRPSPSSTSWAA
jgi:hypothetical protein